MNIESIETRAESVRTGVESVWELSEAAAGSLREEGRSQPRHILKYFINSYILKGQTLGTL
jgi:hypothetical protein